MKVTASWLREFTDVPEDARAVATRLGTCGFNVEGVDGEIIDLEITANRPDCLSVYGLAREAATAFDLTLAPPPGSHPGPEGPGLQGPALPAIRVSIGDAGCGRYALAAAQVAVGPSPEWLAHRLIAAGVRPINNVVDVTNYVMLETGHPMHAFDAAKLSGPEIRVRRARASETLRTLDGQDRTLDETTLVIADRERAVAVAGVMGGAASEVSAGTTHVALESAWFRPALVRAASRRLGLKTEASARFERGADLDAPARALARAIELLQRVGACGRTSPIVDVQPLAIERRVVALDRGRLARLLGDTVPSADVDRILRALGFLVESSPDGWRVTVPSFRVDVVREADLIEEVGRHWGFDRIPATFPALRAMPRPSAPGVAQGRAIRRRLCAAGLQEACTFTFIDADAAAPFAADDRRVRILNPLSEKFAVLRPSLLPGLLDSLIYSRRRESADVALFETGAVFSPSGESQRVGWVLTGSRGEHWSHPTTPVGFTDAKGIAELLTGPSGRDVAVAADESISWCTPGRRARVRIADADVGWIGQIAPAVIEARGLAATEVVVGGEIDLAAVTPAGADEIRQVAPLPRFPSIVRDLSIVVDDRLPAAEVRGTIRAHAPRTLVAVHEFDRYQGKGVPAGRVSLSLRLTFRDAGRTLTDSEVQQAIDAVVAALAARHGAVLRGTSG
jgi:phenylalanyl-tRNA synthetase beta chain